MKSSLPQAPGPIGVFDSGYGGLTILNKIREALPQYDYIYLGDNARSPYGSRSFEIVYKFTLEAVDKLFEMGCHLVILACNTASAKALRSIQTNDLPDIDPNRRVDRKSTRLNSSHANISYAVFCLKKKKKKQLIYNTHRKM